MLRRRATVSAWTVGVALAVWLLGLPSSANAGGFDTPIVHTARQIGVGGTAVAYVADPSALLHNPAGLSHVGRGEVMGSFTLLIGELQASPAPFAPNEETELSVTPLGLLGASARITDWLTAGIGAFPVAQIGGRYEYTTPNGVPLEDETTFLFIETTPALSLELPGNVRIGAGWRVTNLRVDRRVAPDVQDGDPNVDFLMTGTDFASFRAGLQWTVVDEPTGVSAAQRQSLQIGAAYRHEVTVDVEDDSARALDLDVQNLEAEFTLPARISAGIRGDYEWFGVALDVEYALQSQNEETVLTGKVAGMTQSVPQVFEWENAFTVRTGIEYRWLPAGQLASRLGYVYDGKTVNERFPTAFGTPPGATHSFTAGLGYDAGAWEVNLAYAYRRGDAEVSANDLEAGRPCPFCSFQGDYDLWLHGLYLDASYEWE